MKITYLGTTVLLFDDGKDQILFDAHITRPSFKEIGFSKIRTDRKMADMLIGAHKIDRLRAIFVSHTHHDHVMDAPYFARKCHADIYGSKSTLNVARGGKVPEKMLHAYEESTEYEVGAFAIKIIPSIHSKAHWYNNDLGKTVDKPLVQPAKKGQYKEGGSFDFLVKHGEKTYLIRPSFNYIEGQLDGVKADVLFLGISGLSKASEEMKKKFFEETVEKVGAKLVIPVHWDNFFAPLDRASYSLPALIENTNAAFLELAEYCEAHAIDCVVQLPRTSMTI